jgi:hypothetical protein
MSNLLEREHEALQVKGSLETTNWILLDKNNLLNSSV